MIGRLRGALVEVRHDGVVVDVSGVGYEVAMSARGLGDLPSLGDDVVLHTHLHVREDQLSLFGFTSADQRELFRLLLGVSGIGPKVALAILGTLTPDELRAAVLADDVAALTAVPGIGKRSAQKMLLELRPRLELPDFEPTGGGPKTDARIALEGLGYQPDEIRGVLIEMPDDLSVEDLVMRSLQELDKRGSVA
jgi:Holliday junction DNA helicase RuvA